MNDTYETQEGFELAKPLQFPEATDFTELLKVEGPWDFSTMGHRNGRPQSNHPEDIKREGWTKTVGRFCSTRNLPGGRSMVVTPTDKLLDAIYGTDGTEPIAFAFFDHVSFEAIYHEGNDRVLVVANASAIIASRWLAYVRPESVPTYE